MTLTSLQIIEISDQMGEVRDLNAVALMACADLGDRQAQGALSRLLSLIGDQLNTINATLDQAHLGADDEQA